ncbi:MAG: signal peptidase II, partial [Pseudomonadota bacterium]
GFALLIGGALGNLIDRVLYGHVIDFIDASALWFPFVFNVADVCINIGVACVALDFLRNREEAF